MDQEQKKPTRAQERKAHQRQAYEEQKRVRQRLIKIIDDKDTANADCLDAIRILWEMDKATRHYYV